MKLTPLTPSDSPFIQRLVNTPGWLQYIGDRNVKNLSDAEAYVARILANKDVQYWVVKIAGVAAGLVTFIKRDYLPHHDIGFAFLPEFQQKGLAFKATQTILTKLKVKHSRILASTIPENTKSIRLLEKLGFVFDKKIQHDNTTLDIYSYFPYSFRLITPADSVERINFILRSAYKALADAGMRYAASHEDVEATRRNIALGECHLVLRGKEIVGCVNLRPGGSLSGPAWYAHERVMTFGRFAVLPKLQGHGIGSRLMDYIEQRARDLNASEIALDTSEHAHHLIAMYKKRGYQFVQYHKWDITNYRSVVMSKSL